jgi:hypothetical protein
MSNFDWLGLAHGLTVAHCKQQGYKVSASTSPESDTGSEGGVSVEASPSFRFVECGDAAAMGAENSGPEKAGFKAPPLRNEHSTIHDGLTIERLLDAVERRMK